MEPRGSNGTSGLDPSPSNNGPAGDTAEGEQASGRSWDSDTSAHSPQASQGAEGADAAPQDWQTLFSPPQLPNELGRLGGYRILRMLGEGGMGMVFEAEDIALGRKVAIKVLRPGEIEPSQRKRFLQEAQLAASLVSDHIVTIHQVGEDNGRLFIVMQLLHGETLDDRLKRERWLPLAEALRIAREAAEGLAEAHEKHLVHRDIKPANVWLETARPDETVERVKLLDFGVARPVTVQEHLTQSGRIVGTPSYMSPEQACGMPLDQRSDLFSLGCLIYAMLAGKSPFERANYVLNLKAVIDEEPRPLTEVLPGASDRVERLIQSLLQKQADSRPPSARQVAHELRQLELSMTSAGLVPVASDEQLPPQSSGVRRKANWGMWAGAITIVLTALLGGWLEYRHLSLHGVDAPADTQTAAVQGPLAPSGAAPLSPNVSTAGEAPGRGGASSAATPPEQSADESLAGAMAPPVIKVGVVHSLTGPMAPSERSMVDAFLMAFEEINAAGGLLGGRQIEVLVRDGKSNETIFAKQAEELIAGERVVTLFGCWRSRCRKLVEEVCRRHDHLLVYPMTYEGLEASPYVAYLGGAPNQQILPAVRWAFAFQGKRKFFLIGVDGIYSRCAHEIIRDELKSLGGQVSGEGYRQLGDTDFSELARQVKLSGADIVINTVSGTGNISLFSCLRAAGVTPEKTPTISFNVTEEELRNITGGDDALAGDFAAWSYFQSLPNQENQDFLARFHERYGATRVASDPIAAAYAGVRLWAQAVEASQSDRVVDIRKAMLHVEVEAPEGLVTLDPRNGHAYRLALIGEVNRELQYDIVWTSPKPLVPEPFPETRSPDEWRKFKQGLYQRILGAQLDPPASRAKNRNAPRAVSPSRDSQIP